MIDYKRLAELLTDYGIAKFGDEWWPGNAEPWIGKQKSQELDMLFNTAAKEETQ
jgi:hypothetical protein